MVSSTALDLLSALRRTGSSTLLRDVPRDYFVTNEEKAAFDWLCSFVTEFRAFPSPRAFREGTGLSTRVTEDPVDYYVNEARRRAMYLRITEIMPRMDAAIADRNVEAIVEAARAITAHDSALSVQATGVRQLTDAFSLVQEDIESVLFQDDVTGIRSYWPQVDAATLGWQNSDLITIVGRPGSAKTYMMLCNAHAAWLAGKSVLFFSMEMGIIPIARRLLGFHTNINPRYLRAGRLSTIARESVAHAVESTANNVPFHLVAGNFRKSVSSVRAIAEELRPDIIFVDASYLLTPDKQRKSSDGRRESISDVIEGLQQIATDLNRPLLNSVQFNRNAVRKGKQEDPDNPLSHLGLHVIAETDVIGQVSAIVLGLERAEPPHQDDQRYIGLLKGREGETGHWKINCSFAPLDFSVITDSSDRSIGTIDQSVEVE